jgi:hypothetical protein
MLAVRPQQSPTLRDENVGLCQSPKSASECASCAMRDRFQISGIIAARARIDG